MGSVLADRRTQSEMGLIEVRARLADRLSSIDTSRVAVYVTGSFGRFEARYPKGSDLDVFFLYAPPEEDREGRLELPRLEWFKLIAAVIDVAEGLEFEPFSKDGEFLKAHNVNRIGHQLGSRHEDAENVFTARVLLLLESQYLVNEELYNSLLLETIRFYFGDYATNRERFRPHTLINDILRYWRTLCLNYENSRNRLRSSTDDMGRQTDFRATSALANLKLRYSRLAICFSMVAALGAEPAGISPERVLELCRTIPSDRWMLAASLSSDRIAAESVASDLLARYEMFLGLAADEHEILTRLRDPEERDALRRTASEFGDLVYELLKLVVPEHQFRRLVI